MENIQRKINKLKHKSLSKKSFHDVYYDGDIEYGKQCFDEDVQEIGKVFDIWKYYSQFDNRSYIEQSFDDWFDQMYKNNK